MASSWSGKAARLAAGALLMAAVVAVLGYLPVQEYLIRFVDWAQAHKPQGLVLLIVLYVVACLLFIPGSVLTLGAGFAFGVWWGTLAVSAGSVLGATAAFLTGRTLARGWIEQRVARYPKFAAIDRAVAEQGFKIVLLTRLSPIFPFNLLNYAYGLTRVRLRDYVLASWIGMFPATVVFVSVGSAIKNLSDLAAGRIEGGPGQTILFFVGLLAALLVTIYIARLARRALDQAVQSSEERQQRDESCDKASPLPADQANSPGATHVS